jgi:hypothetical protein
MVKKMMFLLILSCLFFSYYAGAEGRQMIYLGYEAQRYPEDIMYILDKGNHYPREFKEVLRDIYMNHVDYTTGEVSDLAIAAYDAIEREKPETTIYDTVENLQRYTADELGIDLTTYIAAYVRSQIE